VMRASATFAVTLAWSAGKQASQSVTLGFYPLDLAAPGSFCLEAEVPVGASVEVVTGLAVTVAWVPRRIERLTVDSNGRQYQVGDAFEGTSAPTQKRWDLNSFGVGLAADATIMKSVVQLFK
ncbi:hypothetical protein, partial [Archangium sp.]|uniref:hypothetical protein n=1 Tax=Archangium sp. TaxID=1872627 RepID=UPI002D3DE7B0